jgi:hypothetical protein
MPLFNKQFKLKVKEIKSTSEQMKKVVTWHDILSMSAGKKRSDDDISTCMDSEDHFLGNLADLQKFNIEDEFNKNHEKFNVNDPLLSFKLMVKNQGKDLMADALDGMSKYLVKRSIDKMSEMRQPQGMQDKLNANSDGSELLVCAK